MYVCLRVCSREIGISMRMRVSTHVSMSVYVPIRMPLQAQVCLYTSTRACVCLCVYNLYDVMAGDFVKSEHGKCICRGQKRRKDRSRRLLYRVRVGFCSSFPALCLRQLVIFGNRDREERFLMIFRAEMCVVALCCCRCC